VHPQQAENSLPALLEYVEQRWLSRCQRLLVHRGGYGERVDYVAGQIRQVRELHKKRKGDFPRETSPSQFRFSEIRFWFQITTLVTPESFGTRGL
jgi:hypothetical protein